MTKIAVIGYKGFVGQALYTALLKADYDVLGVDRTTYEKDRSKEFDILINSAMPSKRYWALNNPKQDFDKTVGLTADLLYRWNWRKFVQISSVSARCQLDHPYGIHKACAELLVQKNSKETLIFRLGALFGEGLKKGVIFDMIKGNEIFWKGDSKYNYISTAQVAEIVVEKINEKGIVEAGAKDEISLREIADYFNLDTSFGNRLELQHTENADDTYPRASEVLRFMESQTERKHDIQR